MGSTLPALLCRVHTPPAWGTVRLNDQGQEGGAHAADRDMHYPLLWSPTHWVVKVLHPDRLNWGQEQLHLASDYKQMAVVLAIP